jgi:hypothetical protein
VLRTTKKGPDGIRIRSAVGAFYAAKNWHESRSGLAVAGGPDDQR